jgi:hypothetical protein
MNADVEFVHDEVSEALHSLREWRLDHDSWPADLVLEQVGDALIALAELHNLHYDYVYGRKQ